MERRTESERDGNREVEMRGVERAAGREIAREVGS